MSIPGQFPQQRVGVFVDIQNLYYSARALYSKKVNFKKILEEAVAGRHLVRALAYGITTEEAHEGDFHQALSDQGFEVKTKPLQTFVGGQKKGDWDVGIAVDVLQLEPKIDVAVLVSGDGDFIPLVDFAQRKGLRVEVINFRASTSGALVQAADSFTDLSQDARKFLIADRLAPRKILRGPAPASPAGRRPAGGRSPK
ncbi:MAG TPA: NYN domain-containing protein, partial [Candidatus Andersenbacteria bacterium]|nr:NYN domain-containing protein [Candidatus Andersenbacteria bacterium]